MDERLRSELFIWTRDLFKSTASLDIYGMIYKSLKASYGWLNIVETSEIDFNPFQRENMASPILSITVICGLSLLNTAAIRATPDSTFTVINTFEPEPTELSLTNSSTPENFRCTDLNAVYHSHCWEALGLTNWLSGWSD